MSKTRILIGDARERLAALPRDSVHCVVTSPPYWGLRSYTGDPGMIGLEPTFDEHLNNLVAVFREVRRVLRPDGTLWLNYGDAYSGGIRAGGSPDGDRRGRADMKAVAIPKRGKQWKPKDLMQMPARVAMALQADGWWLRSEIVWHKPNPMPEPVRDRPTSAHEKVFLLSRSARYFYDAEAVRTDSATMCRRNPGAKSNRNDVSSTSDDRSGGHLGASHGANLRNVWRISPALFRDAHFATFPPKLVQPCVKAGTSEKGCCPDCGAPLERVVERQAGMAKDTPKILAAHHARSGGGVTGTVGKSGGARVEGRTVTTGWPLTCECNEAEPVPCTVLDPFGGAGTVGLVAMGLGRDAILIEISPEYGEMARARLAEAAPMFDEVTVEEGARL